MRAKEFLHPECAYKEFFLMNMNLERIEKFNYPSIRIGKQAYDGKGNKLNIDNWFPIFISSENINKSKLKELRMHFQ